REAVLDRRLVAYRQAPRLATAEAAVVVDGGNPRGLAARGAERLDEGLRLRFRPDGAGRSSALIDGAIEDLRHALAGIPTEPTYHERLARAYGARATLSGNSEDISAAVAHYRRAIASAPNDVGLQVALFTFAVSQRPALLDIALDAGRTALDRDPQALDRVVDAVASIRLDDAQWGRLVPS